MITRYGNERLDYFRPGDVQAVQYVYDHAAPGSTIIGGGTNMPWRNQDYETMDYLVIPDLDGWLNPCIGNLITSQCSPRPKPAEITSEILKLSADRGSWLVITESTKVQASCSSASGTRSTASSASCGPRRAPGRLSHPRRRRVPDRPAP